MSIKKQRRFAKDHNQDGWPIIDNKTGKRYGKGDKDELIQRLNDMSDRIEELEDAWLEMKEQDSKFDI